MTHIELSCHSLKNSISYNRDTWTSLVLAALFTLAEQWNQPRYLSADGWMGNENVEFYSVVKKMKLWNVQVSGENWGENYTE